MARSLAQVRPLLDSGGGIAVAMGVMNVATYAYTMVAARMLGPRAYGGFAAVMGLLLVVGVLQLGLQATGARRVASTPEDVGEIERSLMQITYRVAWGLTAACLVLTPVINNALHLDSLLSAALVGLTAWPMTVMGGQAGILQGERRWLALAALYVAAGVPRFVLGTLLLLASPTEWAAVLGVAVAFVAPVVVGWIGLRRSAGRRSQVTSGAHHARSMIGETMRNSHALLAFLALSNVDVILARSILDRHESGLYAGGLILVKAVLFLPQFVVIVAFPSMSLASARRTALVRSVTLVLALGAVATLGALVLSGLALVFVGGHEYAGIQHQLWVFAVLGTVLSVVQLLVYNVVARQSRRAVYLVWVALAVLALAVTRAGSVTSMVTIVCTVDGVLMLVLLAVSWWRLRGDAEEAAAADAVATGRS